MVRKMFLLGMAVVLVAAFSAAVSAETTEGVLAKITKQRGEVKTFEFDMNTTMKGGEAEGATMKGHLTSQIVEKDGKPVTLMNFKQSVSMGGMTNDMLIVNDGEFVWQEMRMQGQVMVMKTKPDPSGNKNDPQEFTSQYDLKLAGEEKFDGQTCWILEGTPKAKAAGARPAGRGGMGMGGQPEPGKIRIWIGQKDLFVHRYIMFDKAGNEMAETQITNVKLNGTVDAKLFKYTPPPGARVMDMTKGMPDMGGMMPEAPGE